MDATQIEILRAVVDGRHGTDNAKLVGTDAEFVRSAYYSCWKRLGRPREELYTCLAHAIFGNDSIQLWFVRPALAVMLIQWDRTLAPVLPAALLGYVCAGRSYLSRNAEDGVAQSLDMWPRESVDRHVRCCSRRSNTGGNHADLVGPGRLSHRLRF